MLQDLDGAHDLRFVLVIDQHQVGRDRHLAVGEGVERVDDLLGIGAARHLDLDFDLLGGIVGDGADLDLVFTRGIFDRGDELFGIRTEGYVADYDALGVGGVELGAHQHFAIAVIVFGEIGEAASWEVG